MKLTKLVYVSYHANTHTFFSIHESVGLPTVTPIIGFGEKVYMKSGTLLFDPLKVAEI